MPLWRFAHASWTPLRKFASRSNGSADSDLELARSWLNALHSRTIPRHIGQVSFSRSSGPGGQNVNKSVQPEIIPNPPSLRIGEGQFQGHVEGPIGGPVAVGAKFVAPQATGVPLCDRQVPDAGDTIRRIPAAIE
ncbi:hypothetical protein N7532_004239 [Penicillium argentinense]|uniref:Prokaryotic-type class I peptide chain release factors domain-containing protein n=1 Tax=Penicillium argentinense TaxID=1131581 RepID=A0A9W9KEM2_9EURO|nr:uncharacterized protein N7532_004239 [Penicillium argentinense]KAJ5103710.1 hypothetical protein N7532_004239 [Penicillium argentinense]